MAVSVYFNNQGALREQFLIEDLIIESIKNHGIDIFYIPRESQSSLDMLFGDDPVKTFNNAIKIDMYLESAQGFEGNQEFFSKFGLEIQDNSKVSVARRTFEKYVTTTVSACNVPKEGDLIYMPIQQKLMEIKYVFEEKNFMQAGKKLPYMYELSLEPFKYNGELLNTGVDEIDSIADVNAVSIEYTLTAGGTSTFQKRELVYQGASLASATAKGYIVSWSKPDLSLVLRNIMGSFAVGTAIVGNKSGASWSLASFDSMENANTIDIDDNILIEQEADNILDFTETNPFGEL